MIAVVEAKAEYLMPALVAKVSKRSAPEAGAGYQRILELGRLRCALDNAVRDV